jgi:lysophospholipase L1-like esterase
MADMEAIAASLNALLATYGVTRDQIADLLGGAADGGPNGDGNYPVTTAAGATFLVPSPRRLAALSGDTASAVAAMQPLLEAARTEKAAALAAAVRAELAASSAAETAANPNVTAIAGDLRSSTSKIAAVALDLLLGATSKIAVVATDLALGATSKIANALGYAQRAETAMSRAESAAASARLGAGKKNAWLDPFFRHIDIGASFGGRPRWQTLVGSGYAWSLVTNPAFDGRALRRNVAGSANLSGPVIWLDELGAVPGDTVTLRALVVGTGAVVNFVGRPQKGIVGSDQQKAFLTDAGAGVLTTTATPQRVSLTFVVPPATDNFVIYPFTTTASPDFSVVALWGYKGAANAGPADPSFTEDDYQNSLLSSLSADSAKASTSLAYLVKNQVVVKYDAATPNLTPSAVSSEDRNLPFMGWGEVYSPAGISFNAIRVEVINRSATATAKWKTLNVVVRTGNNPEAADSLVVAVGSVTVSPDANSLMGTVIVLRDKDTGAIKTLTDADFTSGKYLMAVYALTDTGTPAACGAPLGTLTNSLGQSFYHAASAPVTGLWNPYTSNLRVGFTHLLVTNAAVVTELAPTDDLKKALGASSVSPTTPVASTAPEVVLPPAIYGVQGRECNFYFDNVFLADASDYLINVDSVGSVGAQQDERWTWIPAGAVTAGNVTFSVNEKRTGTELSTGSVAQRSAAANAGAGLNKKVMFVGDSLTAAGIITQTMLDIAATDAMGITLYGSRGTGANKHEGRGGYTTTDYTTAGRIYRSFTVSGVTVTPAINSTKYTSNGGIFTVQEVYLTNGAGTIICSVDSGSPSDAGMLTKSFGSGDATIAFSATADAPGNPFWINGKIDFPQYLANQGVPALDWVFIALGINGTFGQTSDFSCSSYVDAELVKLDALIASIKASGAATKVALVIPTPPSASQDAFGLNYTTGQSRWRDKRNILIFARQLIARYKSREADRIYLVPSNLSLDTQNNYPKAAAAPVNSRNTAVTKSRQINGVHPDIPGYQQIADLIWAFLKYYAAA